MSQFASMRYPQTNPSNPILLKVRSMHIPHRGPWISAFLDSEPERYFWPNWTVAHVDHARRVLSRLAALSG